MKKWIFLALLGITIFACDKEKNEPDQDPIDKQKIEQYLRDNNLNATADSSGIYYIITEPGVGGFPSPTSNVIVKYKGYLLDGTVFDQTPGNQARPFQLTTLIAGWQIGIPKLKRGGKGTFFIPSSLGYGATGTSSVPANSVLIFEIELVDYL
ncbi:MAG: FKBP-type peptidyl-prolyl cis-trans isomerase [Saprospiraceae bacterium]|nr:FKBP-type peptidyl-prolyl cis-trans isomerase [Saprospiraceae bacterium]